MQTYGLQGNAHPFSVFFGNILNELKSTRTKIGYLLPDAEIELKPKVSYRVPHPLSALTPFYTKILPGKYIMGEIFSIAIIKDPLSLFKAGICRHIFL